MDIQFFEDFERTEYSDFIHGVIGRGLIIATRFDCSCNGLAMAIECRNNGLAMAMAIKTDDFDNFVNKIFSKYRPLNKSINSFELPNDIYTMLHPPFTSFFNKKSPNDICTMLHNARKARNEIAHSLCKGLDGCADVRTDESQFIEEVSRLINDITYGDIVISQLTHIFNKDSVHISDELVKEYQQDVLNWVVKEE